jgi:hypothetical protein
MKKQTSGCWSVCLFVCLVCLWVCLCVSVWVGGEVVCEGSWGGLRDLKFVCILLPPS